MIENYKDKAAAGQVALEIGECDTIMVIERRFDELTGVSVMKPTIGTSSNDIKTQITANEEAMRPYKQKVADLTAILTDVTAKEKERDDLIAAKREKQ